jgi:flagella basal body P-ring formation protein FlgA
VERGSSVSVYARAAGVRIATSGKALAHGAAGETISVEMEGGKQRVQAKVVAPQAVEVVVGGSGQSKEPN